MAHQRGFVFLDEAGSARDLNCGSFSVGAIYHYHPESITSDLMAILGGMQGHLKKLSMPPEFHFREVNKESLTFQLSALNRLENEPGWRFFIHEVSFEHQRPADAKQEWVLYLDCVREALARNVRRYETPTLLADHKNRPN